MLLNLDKLSKARYFICLHSLVSYRADDIKKINVQQKVTREEI